MQRERDYNHPYGLDDRGGPECDSPVGLIVYDKTSAGTETTVAFVQSNSSGISGGMFDFSGARTVDKVAETTASLPVSLTASLSSPTAGAAVLVFCAALTSSSGVTDIKFSPADVINDWMFAYTPTASYLVSGYGLWQNTVGSATLYYPYCTEAASAEGAVISVSLL